MQGVDVSKAWAVCPGARPSVGVAHLPHGTVLTTREFSSVTNLGVGFSGGEKMVYEVLLLSAGVMQIGWSATPGGLPYSENEGVGDFPLTVAADGGRGMVWSVKGTAAEALRWKAGDVLTCLADFSAGTFEFLLNGALCATHHLPTKNKLLRQKAKWYTDSASVDELLVYYVALSLDGGESVVVNCGEAPLRYGRSGYRSLAEHTHQNGPVEMRPFAVPFPSFLNKVMECDGSCTEYTANSLDYLLYYLRRADKSQFAPNLCTFFLQNPEHHWRPVLMMLYAHLRVLQEGGASKEAYTDLFTYLACWLPRQLFTVLSKFLVTVVLHYSAQTQVTHREHLSLLEHVVQSAEFRRSWVRHPLEFRCNLVNLFHVSTCSEKESKEILNTAKDPSIVSLDVIRRSMDCLQSQQAFWAMENRIMCLLVEDESCHRSICATVKYFIECKRTFYEPKRCCRHELPFSFAQYNLCSTLGYLFLSLTECVMPSPPPVDEEEVSSLGGLQWRASALHLLSPELFYLRPGVTELDARVGGSYKAVSQDVKEGMEEEAESASGRDDPMSEEDVPPPQSVSRRTIATSHRRAQPASLGVNWGKNATACERQWQAVFANPPNASEDDAVRETSTKHLYWMVVLGAHSYMEPALSASVQIPEQLDNMIEKYRYRVAGEMLKSLDASVNLNESRQLCAFSESTEPTVTLTNDMVMLLHTFTSFLSLLRSGYGKNFVISLGTTLSYYWSRLHLSESTDTVGNSAESPYAPDKAYLFIPVEAVDLFTNLWVFFATSTPFEGELIGDYANVALSFFDTARRRALSHAETREKVYYGMTSLLGRTEEQRKSVASFLHRQMTDNPEESFLQTTLVDCLHIYAKKGNEADVTALNFLFSLQQAEGCFLPPPRIVDESFWWLSAISDIWQSHSQQPSTRRRQVETADAVYEKLFSSVMSRQDLKMLLLSNINKCNTLLTLLSPSLPVRQSDMMTVEEVREFVSKYKVLRKNLYLFDFLCKVFCLCDQQSQEEDGNSGDIITEDQLDALRRSVMELILQSLIRIPFAAGVEDSVDNRTHLASSEQSAASVRTYLSQISSSSNSKSRAKIVDNVLLGTTTKTVTGWIVNSNISCTVTGLLSPMFSVLLRILKSFGSVVEENPYLSVFASDLPELIRRGRVALLHPCWELGMDGDASRQLSDDEFLPKHVQESIYHLTQLLPVLEGESARYSASGNSRRPKSKKSSAREGRPSTTAGQRDELVTTSVAFSGGVCQICLEAKADTRFVPCRHECCRMCFAMYRNSLIAQEDSNMVCFFCKAKITGLNVNDSD